MALPISPPYPPMEAWLVDTIPVGKEWQYEAQMGRLSLSGVQEREKHRAAVEAETLEMASRSTGKR